MDGKPDGRSLKKLTDAALHWVRGGDDHKEAIADLRRMNAPDEVIQELLDLQDHADFEVWEENWPSLEVFLSVQTQWRATYGAFYGLDYNSLFSVMNLYETQDRKRIFEDIQIIERTILAALNEEK